MQNTLRNHAELILMSTLVFLSVVPVSAKNQISARDWLIQKVCVDAHDRFVTFRDPDTKQLSADPYHCPAHDHLRNLRVGEAFPYYKHDQSGLQRHDSFPLVGANGQEYIINPFDYSSINPALELDPIHGYDIYLLRKDSTGTAWASVGETRDGGGYSTTFFGNDNQPYNGWILFPAAEIDPNSFTSSADILINGNRWVQNGVAWPGSMPTGFGHNLTSWQYIPRFPFGPGGGPFKNLNTLRSLHGFLPGQKFEASGHLEDFYFTELYGVTRWITWRPTLTQVQAGACTSSAKKSNCANVLSAISAQKMCSAGPGTISTPVQQVDSSGNIISGSIVTMTYQGIEFTMTACRDWSAIATNIPAQPYSWVVPDGNLLQNFHFTNGTASWKTANIKVSSLQSNTTLDTKLAQVKNPGIWYVSIKCNTGNCFAPGPDQKQRQNAELYQDIPITAAVTSGTYSFGAIARSESSGPQALQFTIKQLDANGNVLTSTTSSEVSVGTGFAKQGASFCGPGSPNCSAKHNSILRSSSFLNTVLPMTVDPAATTLRFSIQPLSSGTFDIVEAWVQRN